MNKDDRGERIRWMKKDELFQNMEEFIRDLSLVDGTGWEEARDYGITIETLQKTKEQLMYDLNVYHGNPAGRNPKEQS